MCKRLNEAMPVVASMEDDAADGNSDKGKVWIIIVGYTGEVLIDRIVYGNFCRVESEISSVIYYRRRTGRVTGCMN